MIADTLSCSFFFDFELQHTPLGGAQFKTFNKPLVGAGIISLYRSDEILGSGTPGHPSRAGIISETCPKPMKNFFGKVGGMIVVLQLNNKS